MANVFDFIHATNDVLTERGVALPLPGQSTTTPENRAEMGLAIEKQIVGSDVWRTSTHPRPTISCTSSATCRPTAAANRLHRAIC